jgi:hypothetical protein
MRNLFLFAAMLAIATTAQAMKPPREESPASKEALQAFGTGNSDDTLAAAIAAASAHPLGTLENPVRAEGPQGVYAYLSRLRCADGSQISLGAKSPGGVDAFGSVTEVHSVRCGSGAPTDLVFDIYQAENIEKRPPPGFTLEP